jgi:hypothetical protein
MEPFNIDVTVMSKELGLSQQESSQLIGEVLDGITNEFERLLIEEAKIELHSTRNIYIEGIYKKKNSLKESEVGLVGQLPNMIELGSDPFDMKDGFSKSSKKHMKKSGEGWYLTIPFRYANPGSDAYSYS